MPKTLIRIIGVFLVPCLLTDPALSMGLISGSTAPEIAPFAHSRQIPNCFSEQALNGMATMVNNYLGNRQDDAMVKHAISPSPHVNKAGPVLGSEEISSVAVLLLPILVAAKGGQPFLQIIGLTVFGGVAALIIWRLISQRRSRARPETRPGRPAGPAYSPQKTSDVQAFADRLIRDPDVAAVAPILVSVADPSQRRINLTQANMLATITVTEYRDEYGPHYLLALSFPASHLPDEAIVMDMDDAMTEKLDKWRPVLREVLGRHPAIDLLKPGSRALSLTPTIALSLFVADMLLIGKPGPFGINRDDFNSIHEPYAEEVLKNTKLLYEMMELQRRISHQLLSEKVGRPRDDGWDNRTETFKDNGAFLLELMKDAGVTFRIPRTPAEVLLLIHLDGATKKGPALWFSRGKAQAQLADYANRHSTSAANALRNNGELLARTAILAEGLLTRRFGDTPAGNLGWLVKIAIEHKLYGNVVSEDVIPAPRASLLIEAAAPIVEKVREPTLLLSHPATSESQDDYLAQAREIDHWFSLAGKTDIRVTEDVQYNLDLMARTKDNAKMQSYYRTIIERNVLGTKRGDAIKALGSVNDLSKIPAAVVVLEAIIQGPARGKFDKANAVDSLGTFLTNGTIVHSLPPNDVDRLEKQFGELLTASDTGLQYAAKRVVQAVTDARNSDYQPWLAELRRDTGLPLGHADGFDRVAIEWLRSIPSVELRKDETLRRVLYKLHLTILGKNERMTEGIPISEQFASELLLKSVAIIRTAHRQEASGAPVSENRETEIQSGTLFAAGRKTILFTTKIVNYDQHNRPDIQASIVDQSFMDQEETSNAVKAILQLPQSGPSRLTIAPIAITQDWIAGMLVRNNLPAVARLVRIFFGWIAAAVEIIPSFIPSLFPSLHREEDREFAKFWQPALMLATAAGGTIGLLFTATLPSTDHTWIVVASAALANFFLHAVINTHGELSEERQFATAA